MNLIKPTKFRRADSGYLRSIIEIKQCGSFPTDDSCTSLVPTGKDTVWVANVGRDTMQMYGIAGKRIRSVTARPEFCILDLAVKQSGDVIVCYKDKVCFVTKKGTVTTIFDTASYIPKGVSLNENEDIMVCMAGMGDENHVVVYSPDGKKQVKKIVLKDHQGKQLLADPTRVVNGEYISVMNWESNIVTCDEDGRVKWVYDGSQTETGRLDAVGMCVDRFSNLLISDYESQCVHYVDREGVLIQILLTRDKHGIKKPLGIGVDDKKQTVWVGVREEMFHSQVWIFKYLPK